ncbi:cyclic pyranopterin monophosphate synthase MoaC [Opacimonas viscosa]|uniref:Cyclic pyranopterin monophosphate synthase n=1 Tax=Opacimonas viscosa TaxID=2961944 RepID=A0AA41WXK5_9ALTE|nr:cyclic pyranopterin monophosphate synthase MoaC [Opacimonas viscosa]MCP3428210.1 cyclic pyranopterin monophosphate synthase MoaC [Opacimonas viscosa]
MTLTHIDANAQVNMVDVTDKSPTVRSAYAEGYLDLSPAALAQVMQANNKKGDVLTIAKIAGIQGAKQCANLIPLCHPLALSKVEVNISCLPESSCIHVTSMCKLTGVTGVEMEALTAVQIALLTLFDMTKAVDPAMTMRGIRVLQKIGGKTGTWHHPDAS